MPNDPKQFAFAPGFTLFIGEFDMVSFEDASELCGGHVTDLSCCVANVDSSVWILEFTGLIAQRQGFEFSLWWLDDGV